MQQPFFNKLADALTHYRIKSYILHGEPEETSLARYLWNVSLAESLYPCLHSLEVGLRATVNGALASRSGQDWPGSGQVFLDVWQKGCIQSAVNDLASENQPTAWEYVVPELSFGFWTSMLGKRYGREWRGSALRSAFPGLPVGIGRERAPVADRMDRIRRFRNRVMHHERLCHHPLAQVHGEILEAIGWISPDLLTFTKASDRFPAVLVGGLEACRPQLANIYPPDGDYAI